MKHCKTIDPLLRRVLKQNDFRTDCNLILDWGGTRKHIYESLLYYAVNKHGIICMLKDKKEAYSITAPYESLHHRYCYPFVKGSNIRFPIINIGPDVFLELFAKMTCQEKADNIKEDVYNKWGIDLAYYYTKKKELYNSLPTSVGIGKYKNGKIKLFSNFNSHTTGLQEVKSGYCRKYTERYLKDMITEINGFQIIFQKGNMDDLKSILADAQVEFAVKLL